MPRGVYKRQTMKKHIDATDESIENRVQEFSVADILLNGVKPIETASVDALSNDRLDRERFMAETLEVHLHEPTNESENTHAYVGVNGDAMWLVRGGTYMLKRYHVALLATAKAGRVKQSKVIAPDGSQSYIDTEVTSLAYPFTVIADPNPRGGAWLRETLKSAA